MTSGPAHEPDQTQGGAPQEAAAPAPGGETTQEQPMTEQEQDAAEQSVGMAEDTENGLVADLADAQAKVAALTEDLQRLQAEYVNYKRRVDRDRALVLENAKFTVLSSLLPVLDDLDRAREHGDLTGSFGAVADKLIATLTKLGLQATGRMGDHFDPAVHEAVQFGTSAEVTEPTVTTVFRSGYSLGGRLLRPAVVVVTGPEHGAAPTDPGPAGAADSPDSAAPA